MAKRYKEELLYGVPENLLLMWMIWVNKIMHKAYASILWSKCIVSGFSKKFRYQTDIEKRPSGINSPSISGQVLYVRPERVPDINAPRITWINVMISNARDDIFRNNVGLFSM